MAHLELIIVVLVVVLLIAAAITDGATRTIPNWLNLTIALLAIPYWWAEHLSLWPDITIQLALATAVFAVFALFFAIGQMGGGDVKLVTALALFLPPGTFITAFWGFAMIGGIMTLGFYLHWLRQPRGTAFENPYGIAIALGALLALADHYRLVDAAVVLRFLTWPAFAICLAGLVWRVRSRLRNAHAEGASRTIS